MKLVGAAVLLIPPATCRYPLRSGFRGPARLGYPSTQLGREWAVSSAMASSRWPTIEFCALLVPPDEVTFHGAGAAALEPLVGTALPVTARVILDGAEALLGVLTQRTVA